MVGRGTPEPKRSGTSCKTSNGNGGRTENPPALAVGSAKKEIGDFIDTQYPGQWSATASPLTLPPPPDGVTPERDCMFWYDMAMSLSRQVEELKRQLKYSKLRRKKEDKNR